MEDISMLQQLGVLRGLNFLGEMSKITTNLMTYW